jgi:hypothetical protein
MMIPIFLLDVDQLLNGMVENPGPSLPCVVSTGILTCYTRLPANECSWRRSC